MVVEVSRELILHSNLKCCLQKKEIPLCPDMLTFFYAFNTVNLEPPVCQVRCFIFNILRDKFEGDEILPTHLLR